MNVKRTFIHTKSTPNFENLISGIHFTYSEASCQFQVHTYTSDGAWPRRLGCDGTTREGTDSIDEGQSKWSLEACVDHRYCIPSETSETEE